mgnify:CR=1 FL=1
MKQIPPTAVVRRAWWWPYLAVTALVLSLVATKWDRQTGFTSLLRFGDHWHALRLPVLQPLPVAKAEGSGGYDGQFYAQLAVDPLLRAPELKQSLDGPEYRARRIFMPWVAALLGFNRPWWTLQIFALLNVAAWVVVAWLLRREIADDSGCGLARWSACVLSLGAMESVRQSLVDLPALALTLWAVSALRGGRLRRSMLIWPLAVLTKETAMISVGAVQGWPMRQPGAIRRTAIGLMLAALPLALWLVYVDARLGHSSGSGLPGNFDWPGLALSAQVTGWVGQLTQGDWSDRAVYALIGVVALAVQGVVVVRQWQPESIWWRIGVAHVALMLVLGEWVWSGYWAGARALLPLTVAFNLLLPAGRGFWPLWIAGNLSLVHGLFRFL